MVARPPKGKKASALANHKRHPSQRRLMSASSQTSAWCLSASVSLAGCLAPITSRVAPPHTAEFSSSAGGRKVRLGGENGTRRILASVSHGLGANHGALSRIHQQSCCLRPCEWLLRQVLGTCTLGCPLDAPRCVGSPSLPNGAAAATLDACTRERPAGFFFVCFVL